MSILNILERIILWSFEWLLDFQFFFFEFVLAKNRLKHTHAIVCAKVRVHIMFRVSGIYNFVFSTNPRVVRFCNSTIPWEHKICTFRGLPVFVMTRVEIVRNDIGRDCL